MRFTRTRHGVASKLSPVEAAVLTQTATDLIALLGPAAAQSDDPVAELVSLAPEEVPVPDDPALARLLPDAYADDPAASAEFRRFTDGELRAGKREAAAAVLAALAQVAGGGRLRLTRDAALQWLSFLNDVRLVLGTRLEVTEDLFEDEVDPEDPRAPAIALYSWLGWVQESLLSCLDPGGR